MATILVTGITGTIMPPLCALLIERGHSIVALVRTKEGVSPEERIQEIFGANSGISVLTGDITKPLAGVKSQEVAQWRDKIDKVIHGAASSRFFETPDGKIQRTNICGTKEMLNLAREVGAREFHFLSTAYIAGDAKNFLETNLWEGQRFYNDYVASKALTEEYLRETNIPTSIYRLATVVGDSLTGQISSFTGYYQFLAPFWRLRQIIFKKWQKESENCQKDGIRIDEGGNIHIPLFIPCSPIGPLNLVPIDWLSKILAELMEIQAEGKTFHLTHPNPPRVKTVIKDSLLCLGFRDIVCGGQRREKQEGVAARLQNFILRGIEPFSPLILNDQQDFGNFQVVKTLLENGKEWGPPPPIDSSFIQRLVNFAIQRNFVPR